MLMIRFLAVIVLLVIALVGCGPGAGQPAGEQVGAGMGMGRGMGPNSGMMARHQAPIPAGYAGLTNPIEPTEESLARGEAVYTTQCATCHGDGGMGDGLAGVALDPAPGPVAHTSQMLGDDYLFWRISEGGSMFNSTMLAYKDVLSEEQRWDVINYMRALGSGGVTPKPMMGGQAYDPNFENKLRAQILTQALEQDVLTQAEADTFETVHQAMDQLRADGSLEREGGMAQMQAKLLDELVNSGTITQAQADTFQETHAKLLESGLMP